MLHYFLYALHSKFSLLNVFRYITFRAILAILTALVISFFCGPWVIQKLKQLQVKQYIRDDGPSKHLEKEGTPTMGGTLKLSLTGNPLSSPRPGKAKMCSRKNYETASRMLFRSASKQTRQGTRLARSSVEALTVRP